MIDTEGIIKHSWLILILLITFVMAGDNIVVLLIFFVSISITAVILIIYYWVEVGKEMKHARESVWYFDSQGRYICKYCGNEHSFKVKEDRGIVICMECGRSNSTGGIEKKH